MDGGEPQSHLALQTITGSGGQDAGARPQGRRLIKALDLHMGLSDRYIRDLVSQPELHSFFLGRLAETLVETMPIHHDGLDPGCGIRDFLP